MKRFIFSLMPLYLIMLICMVSCDKTPEGYIEVRNQSNFVIEKVCWGEKIDLGTIKPDEENGAETELIGDEFIYMSVDNQRFRAKDEITVDARTSANFIVEDTADLVS